MTKRAATKSEKNRDAESTGGQAYERTQGTVSLSAQADILALQDAAGNQAVSHSLQPQVVPSPVGKKDQTETSPVLSGLVGRTQIESRAE